MKEIKFHEWLKSRLDKRGWSQTVLSERSGIAQSTISTWLSDQGKKPNVKGYVAIAKALDVPLETVLAVAGEVEAASSEVAEEAEMVGILRGLNADERGIVLRMLRGLRRGR